MNEQAGNDFCNLFVVVSACSCPVLVKRRSLQSCRLQHFRRHTVSCIRYVSDKLSLVRKNTELLNQAMEMDSKCNLLRK